MVFEKNEGSIGFPLFASSQYFLKYSFCFVNENKLSEAAVDKLSQDLENDGFDLVSLMDMPKKALNRILSAYVGTNYQKNLERKSMIQKELPINQTSKVDVESLNKDIDKLARELAGK